MRKVRITTPCFLHDEVTGKRRVGKGYGDSAVKCTSSSDVTVGIRQNWVIESSRLAELEHPLLVMNGCGWKATKRDAGDSETVAASSAV